MDYILGPWVKGLAARDETQVVVSTPAWVLVMAYCHAIRKKAMRLCEDKQLDIATAMVTAREDTLTKERYFITPLAICPKGPPERQRSRSRNRYDKGPKGKGKRKDKSKGKGKGGGVGFESKATQHDKTPDGKSICRAFNDPRRKCEYGRKQCRWAHV